MHSQHNQLSEPARIGTVDGGGGGGNRCDSGRGADVTSINLPPSSSVALLGAFDQHMRAAVPLLTLVATDSKEGGTSLSMPRSVVAAPALPAAKPSSRRQYMQQKRAEFLRDADTMETRVAALTEEHTGLQEVLAGVQREAQLLRTEVAAGSNQQQALAPSLTPAAPGSLDVLSGAEATAGLVGDSEHTCGVSHTPPSCATPSSQSPVQSR
jgi:hypothetical protein